MLRIAVLPLLASLSFACVPTTNTPAAADASESESPPADAAPGTDADPSCSAWRALDATLVSVTLLESEPVRVARSARVRIGLLQCPGDRSGLWGTIHPENQEYERLSVWSSLWRAGNDCHDPEPVTRDITLRFASAGSWRLEAGESELVVEVLAEAAGTCAPSPTGSCQRDCDCPSAEVCLSGTANAGSLARCAQPCQFDRDCQGNGVCGNQDGLEGICLREVPECELPARDCSEGFRCVSGTCEPDFRLDQSTRHECSCDAECDTGLRCVESQGGSSSGRCEAICATPSDVWCQGAHTCNAEASVEAGQGVCAWVGD